MKRVALIACLLICVVLGATGCFLRVPIPSYVPTVYIAGTVLGADGQYACYWVGNELQVLDKGIAMSIAVNGEQVYTSGLYLPGNRPCFWEGTTRRELGTGIGQASEIVLYEGHVYTGGYEWDSTAGRDIPYYWKGTEPNDLSFGVLGGEPYDAWVQCMHIADGYLYTAGDYENGVFASYRELGAMSGVTYVFSGSKAGDTARAIVSTGNMLKTAVQIDSNAGCWSVNTSTTEKMFSWFRGPDGVDSLLGPLGGSTEVLDMIVYNGQTYAVGGCKQNETWVPCLWIGTGEEGALHLLPATEFGGQAESICIVDDVIYIAGLCVNKDEDWDSSYPFPCYWEAGTRHDLSVQITDDQGSPMQTYLFGIATSIVVK